MSYDLYAINKNAEVKELRIGWMSWGVFLEETGMGYILGYGRGRVPGSYVYKSGSKGSPMSNDGYRVTSSEAKIMAKIARGYLSVQRFVNKEWDEIEEPERQRQMDLNTGYGPTYRPYFHEDRLKKLEEFASFAEKSGGFTIR